MIRNSNDIWHTSPTKKLYNQTLLGPQHVLNIFFLRHLVEIQSEWQRPVSENTVWTEYATRNDKAASIASNNRLKTNSWTIHNTQKLITETYHVLYTRYLAWAVTFISLISSGLQLTSIHRWIQILRMISVRIQIQIPICCTIIATFSSTTWTVCCLPVPLKSSDMLALHKLDYYY